MIKLACLGRGYREQIQTQPEALQGVELIWQGTDLPRLLRLTNEDRPQVLLVELEALGDHPSTSLRGLASKLEPELVLLVFRFARRQQIAELTSFDGVEVRALQGPVTLTTLRSQMLGLIVRDLLGGDDAKKADANKSETCPECGRLLLTGDGHL